MPDILIVLAIVAVAQTAFLAVYLLIAPKVRSASTVYLSLLLIGIAVRIAKSVLWSTGTLTSDWFLNIGFAFHTIIGPLLWIHVRSIFKPGQRISLWEGLHFAPFLAILSTSHLLSLDRHWYSGGYDVLLIQCLGYVALCAHWLRTNRRTAPDRKIVTWCIGLTTGIGLFALAYFTNYVLGWTAYMAGPGLYAGVAYAISFYALRNQGLFQAEKKESYQNLNLAADEKTRLVARLQTVMRDKRPYLDPGLTLGHLAEQVQISAYQLSFILNTSLRKNFSEYLNGFRVDHAKNLLRDPSRASQKIAALAYECGFNSLSSFNTAFKKHVGSTPSDYRRKAMPDS